jgi:hypothetical protein
MARHAHARLFGKVYPRKYRRYRLYRVLLSPAGGAQHNGPLYVRPALGGCGDGSGGISGIFGMNLSGDTHARVSYMQNKLMYPLSEQTDVRRHSTR